MKKIITIATVAIIMVAMLLPAACSTSSQDRLKEAVEEGNKECPATIDRVTTLVEIKLDDEFVTYVCEIDEKQLSLDQMQAQRDIYTTNIHNMVKQQVTNPQSANGPFFILIMDAGKGLRHRYKGNNSRKTLDIDITNAELQHMATSISK